MGTHASNNVILTDLWDSSVGGGPADSGACSTVAGTSASPPAHADERRHHQAADAQPSAVSSVGNRRFCEVGT